MLFLSSFFSCTLSPSCLLIKHHLHQSPPYPNSQGFRHIINGLLFKGFLPFDIGSHQLSRSSSSFKAWTITLVDCLQHLYPYWVTLAFLQWALSSSMIADESILLLLPLRHVLPHCTRFVSQYENLVIPQRWSVCRSCITILFPAVMPPSCYLRRICRTPQRLAVGYSLAYSDSGSVLSTQNILTFAYSWPAQLPRSHKLARPTLRFILYGSVVCRNSNLTLVSQTLPAPTWLRRVTLPAQTWLRRVCDSPQYTSRGLRRRREECLRWRLRYCSSCPFLRFPLNFPAFSISGSWALVHRILVLATIPARKYPCAEICVKCEDYVHLRSLKF